MGHLHCPHLELFDCHLLVFDKTEGIGWDGCGALTLTLPFPTQWGHKGTEYGQEREPRTETR